MSGYSFQIILQHIKLKDGQGRTILRSVSLAPSRPRSEKSQPPPSTGPRRLVHQSCSFDHRNVGTRTSFPSLLRKPIFKHFPHFNPGAPNSSPIFPRRESGSPAPFSLKDSEIGLSSSSSSFQDPIIPAHVEPPSRPERAARAKVRSKCPLHPLNPTAGHLAQGSRPEIWIHRRT